ncbi:hypothetical protein [Pseudohalioglobus lutimaris]|uniref:hypothetical protein n=1 Tax=Pseudohalioglobus lutimaris TaxID=1737061 RepID=UPI001054F8DB|nr:hypothetical protein [Pseudohalioglobus lutimaris]
MTAIRTVVLGITAVLIAWAPAALTQEGGAKPAPVEAFYCNLQPGKSMKDLMKVAGSFSRWAGKNDPTYAAWILTPQFATFTDGPQLIWLGSHPSGNHMGKGLDAWQAGGGDIQEEFNEVIACGQHGLASSVEINAPDGPPEDGVVMFVECSMADEGEWQKAIAGHKKYAAAMRSLGAKNSNWVFFPMLGGSSDRDFDYWSVATFSNWTDYFAAYEIYMTGGGWQKGMESLKGAATCAAGSATVWDAKMVHKPAR